MTNGEKLCIDFPDVHYTIIGVCASFDLDWWNAEYKEPTTPEHQAESDKFDAAFQDGYDHGYAQARFDYEQEPTPKNDLGVDKTFYKQMVEYCNEHFLVLVEKDVWEDARKALTTKNNLGVDCISRADARSLICNTDIKHHMFGMSRKVFKDLYNGMDELPSVTPQEPKTGHWIPVYQGDEIIDYRCSECEFGNTFGKSTIGMNFCPNCGCKME